MQYLKANASCIGSTMKKFLLIGVLLLVVQCAHAQQGKFDTIPVGVLIINGDTILHKYLETVVVVDQAPEWLVEKRKREKKDREAYQRLRYNVYVVYPYAVMAGIILQDIDSVLQSLNSKVAKKEFKRRKENELNRKFKGELENLSISQGQILVKLIARQTGKPCYVIVKELKGGFNARIFQGMALLFDNNLRNTYDAAGDDAAIEQIVQEIEQRGHFEYKR